MNVKQSSNSVANPTTTATAAHLHVECWYRTSTKQKWSHFSKDCVLTEESRTSCFNWCANQCRRAVESGAELHLAVYGGKAPCVFDVEDGVAIMTSIRGSQRLS